MTRLGERIARQIAAYGPLSVAQFMALALHDPKEGYYRHAQAVGRSGDFITAPEVSQVFGELLGLWCIDAWQRLGRPQPMKLIELGPGRGTLMADALRALALMPALAAQIEIHLVEVNEALRAQQRVALAGRTVTWHDSLDAVPPGPFVLLANEFFDALPIRQIEYGSAYCRERMVGLNEFGELTFALSGPLPRRLIPENCVGDIVGVLFEVSPAAQALMAELALRVCRDRGAALIVDYGYDVPSLGSTLQAVRKHERVDPLSEPGRTDLSAHVDFAALAQVAERAGGEVWGPLVQAEFLGALGAGERFQALHKANPERAEALDAAEHRLIGSDQMGCLFQALTIVPPGFGEPAGFALR